jgi:hypothetical protein
MNIRAIIPEFMANRTNVSYADEFMANPPSGATMAKPVPTLNLQSSLTVTQTAGSAAESNGVYLYRTGNVCQLTVAVHTTGTVYSGATLFGMSSNIPKPTRYCTACDITGTYLAVAWLNADGTMSSRMAIGDCPSNRYFQFTFTYLSDENLS